MVRTARNAAFDVPGGSSGEFHAIVITLQMMTVRMQGSKYQDSTSWMHGFRGQSDTARTKKVRS